MKPVESNGAIRIPRWVFIMLVGLFLNLLTIFFSAGFLWSKVDSIDRRVERIEDAVLKPKQ